MSDSTPAADLQSRLKALALDLLDAEEFEAAAHVSHAIHSIANRPRLDVVVMDND